jgi:hypothetical protein
MFTGFELQGNGTHRMKAAATVFERVALFGVGVLIFIVSYSIFLNYQAYFIELSLDDQLDEVGNHITTNILKLAEKEFETEASISVKIPPRIGDEPFFIELYGEGLNITTTVTGKKKTFKLYGLSESYILGGERILSTQVNEFIIYKKENRIILL